jgi:hypothetical protein
VTELQGGQVTLADLFRVLTSIQTNLATMATKLEVIDTRNKNADAIDGDHEKRIRTLEAFRWKILGMALAVSGGAGALGAWVGYLAGHH